MRGGAAFRASARREHWLPPRWAERPRAYTGPFPITAARTLAQVDRDEADIEQAGGFDKLSLSGFENEPNSPPLTPLPAAVEQPAAVVPPPPVASIDETPGRAIPTIAARGDEGLAPEGTSGGPAGSVRDRHPANASQCAKPAPTEGAAKPEPLPAPVVRGLRQAQPERAIVRDKIDLVPPPGRIGRSVEDGQRGAARHMPVPPEPAPHPAPVRREAEAYGEIKRPPKVDWGRVAEAAKRQAHAPPVARAKVLQPALSKDPCRRCGVPGFRGCEHQLPYDEAAL